METERVFLFYPSKTLIIDGKGIEDWAKRPNVFHISLFGCESAENDIRNKAREWIANIGNAVSRYTGKPIYKSLIYKGVSAWWFIEINLHEPAFLALRRRAALERAKEKLTNMGTVSQRVAYRKACFGKTLPTVEALSLFTSHSKRKLEYFKNLLSNLSENISDRLTFYIQKLQLFKLKSYKVIAIIEEENLRFHIDPNTTQVFPCLPYAEGIFEKLASYLGKDFAVISKKPLRKNYPKWAFFVGNLPFVFIKKKLPEGFELILQDIYEMVADKIGDYLSVNDLKNIMRLRLAEFDTYLRFLAHVDPKIVFIYNWEGVFRPLIAAAKKQKRIVVGIQQALGPYQHGLNHKEIGYWTPNNNNYLGFCVPDKYLLWSDFHKKNMISYGYSPDSLEVTGYPRLDRHFKIATSKVNKRKEIANLLHIDPDSRYLLLTAQFSVLDTCLITKENYRQLFFSLLKLADEYNFKIILKPWASDDTGFLYDLVFTYDFFEVVYIASQNLVLHNAELLSLTDWCVGTFSSIIGEAVLLDNACFLLNYPESRYYFEPKYLKIYRDLAIFVHSPEELEKTLRPFLSSEERRLELVKKAKRNLPYVFGPCNGKAADNCARVIISLLDKKE